MAEITWTLEAIRCLEQIHNYVGEDSPSAAKNVVRGIYEKVQSLRKHTRLGQRYEPITNREVREVLFGHYRIPYLVKSEDQIEVLGVFHGAMDIERYLT